MLNWQEIMQRCDLRSVDIRWLSRIYVWDTIKKLFPETMKNASPTDIDYFLERRNHFLFFEFKMIGSQTVKGQELAHRRLIEALGGKGILLMCYHEDLRGVDPFKDVEAVNVLQFKDGLLRETGLIAEMRAPKKYRPILAQICRLWGQAVESGNWTEFQQLFANLRCLT